LHTDDEPIRVQSAIAYKSNPEPGLLLTITAFFGIGAFYAYQKHAWRAQRAGSLVPCNRIQFAVYNFYFRIQGRSS
jgi:hypothetical protein